MTRISPRRQSRTQRPAPVHARVKSEDKQLLASLREQIEQLPAIDATRVVQLHQQIMGEDYEIDFERLAEKLLALEQSLGD